MNFKKLFSSAVAGLSMMAFAGAALAGNITSDINIYGASAQFNFWKSKGTAYMTSQGCNSFEYGYYADAKKDYIIKASCAQGTTPETYATRHMRISSKASFDGCLAVMGDASSFGPRVKTCDVPGNPASYKKRPMISADTCTYSTNPSSPGNCTARSCETVTVGASDTDCKCFTQVTEGNKLGPLGGDYITSDMTELPKPADTIPVCKPMVVPFSFFVNNTVTKNSATISSIGYDNLQLIFSGWVFDWSQIVDTDLVPYNAQTLVACMRHAGSGTQASLEAYLMASRNCSKYNYLAWQQSDGLVYFNDGSSDMMKCVNGSGAWSGTGAIGYADSDQNLSSYPNVKRLQVYGVPTPLTDAGIKSAIVNGTYNFYGEQHLYGVAPTDSLCTFVGTPANLSAPMAATSELLYKRNNTCCAWGQTLR
ncbi:MAG: hypothetical protein ABFD06_11250 [Smithella sp.]|jgi:hypothetical protein